MTLAQRLHKYPALTAIAQRQGMEQICIVVKPNTTEQR